MMISSAPPNLRKYATDDALRGSKGYSARVSLDYNSSLGLVQYRAQGPMARTNGVEDQWGTTLAAGPTPGGLLAVLGLSGASFASAGKGGQCGCK